ncbi:MAG: 2Fe-2S iron-sulfur cluster-binding protein [Candidatus Binatia bacterium]|nr:2Fe-2S iron-sulfur cluster-binding protein [Candidatus Binatia bacterium]
MSDRNAGSKFENPVTLNIDGREIVAEKGDMLLQVALDNGIEIPHYCYHPKLSIDGSCRMCQVKTGAPKLAIACNTPVGDGMEVDTQSEEVAKARRGVMELLLINHPLDCPICDQAGECYLQDYSYGYGREDARTSSPRRKGLKRHPIGPRVVFDQERCILCRRCVRFTNEISKTDELGVFGIGDHSHIGTAPGQPLDNDYSINTADICPVGALLSEDFHHKRRVWFLEETQSVCPSCSNGCNVKLGMFKNEIQRLVPRRNDDVNETWMCDHGRLHYAFAQDETRVRDATVRSEPTNGATPVVSTDEALAAASARIRAVIDEHGAGAVGILGSGSLTNEEQYHLAALARDAIGTPNVDVVVPMGDADGFLIQAEKVANARGAREMGVVPGEGGSDVAGILAAAASGDIKLLYVVGSEALAEVAEDEALHNVLDNVETLILQDTNQAPWADKASVVLPGQVWAEKDGTFTNHAGRVQRVRRAMTPAEGSYCDGGLFTRLAALLAGGDPASARFDARATLAEVAAKVSGYEGMSFERLGSLGVLVGEAAPPPAPAETEEGSAAAEPG